MLATEGERLSARFFVAKLESAVGFLCLLKETVGVGDREDREMDTTRDLCFDLDPWHVVFTVDGDVVLA